jgi:hypothetical protein
MNSGRTHPKGDDWQSATELRDDAFHVLQKTGGVLNPSSVIATVNKDGSPRTAPFGSLHAVSKTLLRVVVHRHHETLANMKREPYVMIFFASPPSIAIGIRGSAKVVEEPWRADANYALVEISIHEIKNDLPRVITIESGIMISATGPFQEWWKACWKELKQDKS